MTKNFFNINILRKIALFFLLTGATAAYLILILECFHPTIIRDETFSMSIIKHSYFDIVSYTARDVHPPLYYVILKFFVEFFSLFSISAVSSGKLTSAIPYFLLLIISAFYIRKHFGKLTSAIFIGMANMQNFGVQIRMYSWGMFFVTVACLSAYGLLKNPHNTKSIICFILCILMASYTHYFACIASASIYITLLFWLYFNNLLITVTVSNNGLNGL